MSNLEAFLPNVTTQDTRKRILAHQELVPYLSDPHSSLSCPEMDEFIGGLVGWVNCSNYKISINGLEVLCLMVDRMGEDFKIHVSSVLPSVVDRLGDSKDQVREMAQQLLLKLMMPATSPQFVFDRIQSAFTHKLWHVRDEVMICLQNTINTYGSRCLQFSKIVPNICKLLDDQNSQVRETAICTLAEVYRHVGEKVRQDLAKKGIPAQRLNQIYAKFDEIKHSGGMLATADFAPSHRSDDETDFARPLTTKVPQAKRVSSASSTGSGRKSVLPTKSSSSTGSAASGALCEDAFSKSFEDVPKIQLFSSRDVQDHLTKIQTILGDTNNAWEKRNDAMKSIRSVIIAGGMEHDDFMQNLRNLEVGLISAVKDLRSQIVREACITLAYMSQQLCHRFEHMAESILQHLINLIPNSAKIMASSGTVCIHFIIQYTHSSRLVPIITCNLTSKSNIIRRQCYEFLHIMLQNWSTHILEKHIANLQDSIKRGISDADAESRVFARKAFWGFADHFKDQADVLLNSLEPSKQKLLHEQCSGSSSNSVNSGEGYKLNKPRPRSASQDRSTGFDSSTLGRIGKKKHSHFSSARSDTGAANSRSGSPTSRISYLTHSSTSKADSMTPRSQRKPTATRSQGASREGSPNRLSMQPGRERRLSGGKTLPTSGSKTRKSGVMAQRTLRTGSDVEEALTDALRGQSRRRFEYDSDDAASETSSVCSERSYRSIGQTSEDTSEIISLLGSGSYGDRKEGLIALQNLLRSGRFLNRVELQKVCEVFTRMFHDPQSKVLSLFLDTLVDLVSMHHQDLTNQMFSFLTRLLNKTGQEMLGSVQIRVQKALDAIRENFPCDHQFNVLTKYIIDQTQSPSLKSTAKSTTKDTRRSEGQQRLQQQEQASR